MHISDVFMPIFGKISQSTMELRNKSAPNATAILHILKHTGFNRNAKVCPILANSGYFVANLGIGFIFTGLNSAVVYQN